MRKMICVAISLACTMAFAQPPPSNTPWRFPQYGPVAGADPDVTHGVDLDLPTQLIQSGGEVRVDPSTLQTVKLAVGEKMLLGLQSEWRVYGAGKPRPERAGVMGLSGSVNREAFANESLGSSEGVAKGRTVECILSVFETDIPPQHMWMPEGPEYKVLWSKTLRMTVR